MLIRTGFYGLLFFNLTFGFVCNICFWNIFLTYSNNGFWSGTSCVTNLFINVLFYHLFTKSRTFVACDVHEYVCILLMCFLSEILKTRHVLERKTEQIKSLFVVHETAGCGIVCDKN